MSTAGEAALRVRFEGLSPADANVAAAELRDMIDRAANGQIDASIRKERTDTQDFGATLVLILGTEAALVLAKAVYAYVAKRGDRVVIETEDGKVVATGAAAQNIDVAETAEKIRKRVDGR